MDISRYLLTLIVIVVTTVNDIYAQPIEVRNYHDENETLIKEIFFIQDAKSAKLTGPFKSYYINGTLERKGFYKNNLPDSTWHYFYESGQLKMKGILKEELEPGTPLV